MHPRSASPEVDEQLLLGFSLFRRSRAITQYIKENWNSFKAAMRQT